MLVDEMGGRPAKLFAKEVKTIRALLKTADIIPVAEIAAALELPGLPSTAPSSILPPDSSRYRSTRQSAY